MKPNFIHLYEITHHELTAPEILTDHAAVLIGEADHLLFADYLPVPLKLGKIG